MPVVNGVVICNGTNPPKKKKNGDQLPKTLNPLAPEFVPKVQEPTPPDSGRSTFVDPVHTTPVKQNYPPYLGPFLYPEWPQEPYQGTGGSQVPYLSPYRQAFNASYQVEVPLGYTPYPAPAAAAATAAACGYESHISFGRNITQEIMAVLNNPSPPKPSTSTDGSQAPAHPPPNAVPQTS
ncbi:hypothetical protein GE21DRAFT_6079 [Neurospora crassa]|uniref:Uncharacterized protein n=2 Tax=Neurospora crassa TaxID=5141 RepID=Q7RZ42_NEUCR|nr:hypothetical protein NCU04432 [Neurospora crassa OR74A]EAA28273.1 hypothetical protein NCU04432 [Neurospora crassa OR74A]KHE88585.1 hypothetical protein GE21DRAFT_6079 [Neurospora crassa]CAF06014.1 hypothetical protein G21B4.290 [Neurospora crassa]|eukprot:XP_957509.1 hypothetical protein NCU04432 [Neurospora crassa OR74A]